MTPKQLRAALKLVIRRAISRSPRLRAPATGLEKPAGKRTCRLVAEPHGLRAAAVTYFAEKSATEHRLMAWFGWTSIQLALVYTKAASRTRMAAEAAKLITGTDIILPDIPVSQSAFGNYVVS